MVFQILSQLTTPLHRKHLLSFSVTRRVKYKLHILFVVSAAIWPGEPRTVFMPVVQNCPCIAVNSVDRSPKSLHTIWPHLPLPACYYHVLLGSHMPTTLPMSILFEYIRLILLSFLYLQNTSSPDFIMAFSFISSCLC